MSTRSTKAPVPADAVRRRLPREDRYRQLMDEAWRLVREEGADALTLARLGERCGVTKPVVYDHFGTLPGLLTALYLEFDARQTQAMEAALAAAPATLAGRAAVMAAAYVDCSTAQGRELPGVIGALQGTPEMHEVKRRCERDFIARCRTELAPFAADGELPAAGLWAIVGAAESLSAAAVERAISAEQARQELTTLMVALAKRRTAAPETKASARRPRTTARRSGAGR